MQREITPQKKVKIVFQFDGENDDTSSDNDEDATLFGDTGDISSLDDEEEDDHKSDKKNGEVKEETVKVEDEELCSDDDLSSEEEDLKELSDTDDVVCQYDKIYRSKKGPKKWKLKLKLGIMNLNGIDHVFHSAVGEVENL